MAKVVDTQTVRDRLGDIINQAHYRGDEFLVQRGGKSLVAIIPYEAYEQYRKQREADFRVFHEIWKAHVGIDAGRVAEEVADALAEARAEKRERTEE